MSSLPPLNWGRNNQQERMYCMYCTMHPRHSGTDMIKPNFPSWAETRGAVAEIQFWQPTGRLWTVRNKQKSFWQLFHMGMQIIYPFGKTADQVYLRLLKLLDLFQIIRRHAYTPQSFIIRTPAFRFLPPTSAVCFSPFSSMNTGKDE